MRPATERVAAGGGRFGTAAPRVRTPAVMALLFASLLGLLAGCANSLSASSSCQDFLNASQSDQVQAIDSIAAQEHAPDATTPLGMPNVSYLCANDPGQTLGWAVQQTG
jgi:hypothetical protein